MENLQVGRKTKISLSTIVCIVLAVILFLLAVPIVVAAFHSRPISDDYIFLCPVYKAAKNGGGIWGIIKAAAECAANNYQKWQGSFSTTFINALTGVYAKDYYWINTLLVFGGLTFSVIFLFDTILHKVCHQKRSYGIAIALFAIINMLEFVPYKAETFYWFSGSGYYSLGFCYAVIWFAILIRLLISKKIKAISIIFACVLSVIIGGGNYTSALFCSELAVITIIVSVVRHDRKKLYVMLSISLFLFVSFIISIIAPGNSVRAATVTSSSPIEAVWLSVYNFVKFIGEWTRLPQFVLLIFAFPFLYKTAEKVNFDFRWPILVTVGSVLLFSSQLTPPLYAMSMIGYGRQIDIYYYSYYLLVLMTEFYVAGWVSHHLVKSSPVDIVIERKNGILAFISALAIWVVGCFGIGINTMSSAETAWAYKSGLLTQYKAEYDEMIMLLENAGPDDIVETKGISREPGFFWGIGLSEDPNFWVNEGMCAFFDVKGLVLKK